MIGYNKIAQRSRIQYLRRLKQKTSNIVFDRETPARVAQFDAGSDFVGIAIHLPENKLFPSRFVMEVAPWDRALVGGLKPVFHFPGGVRVIHTRKNWATHTPFLFPDFGSHAQAKIES